MAQPNKQASFLCRPLVIMFVQVFFASPGLAMCISDGIPHLRLISTVLLTVVLHACTWRWVGHMSCWQRKLILQVILQSLISCRNCRNMLFKTMLLNHNMRSLNLISNFQTSQKKNNHISPWEGSTHWMQKGPRMIVESTSWTLSA